MTWKQSKRELKEIQVFCSNTVYKYMILRDLTGNHIMIIYLLEVNMQFQKFIKQTTVQSSKKMKAQ